MMLVNSGVRHGGGPMRFYGGVAVHSVERGTRSQPGNLRNFQAGEATVIAGAGIANKSAIPLGYLHPVSWSLPQKPGGMATRYIAATGTLTASCDAGWDTVATITVAGTLSPGAVGAFPATSAMVGSGALTPGMSALGYLVTTMDGTATAAITIVGAFPATLALDGALTPSIEMSGAAGMIAALDGAMTATIEMSGGAAMVVSISGAGTLGADAVATFLAVATLTGSATLTPDASALASIDVALTGALTMTPGAGALGSMELDITQTSETLTTDAIASAVWSHGSALTLLDAVDLIRKISDNRLEVDVTGQRLVLYDDDGVTEIRAWALGTDGGEAIATATGVQTTRGAPT